MQDQIISAVIVVALLTGWSWWREGEMLHNIETTLNDQRLKIEAKTKEDTQAIFNAWKNDLITYNSGVASINESLQKELNENNCDSKQKMSLSKCTNAMIQASIAQRKLTDRLVEKLPRATKTEETK